MQKITVIIIFMTNIFIQSDAIIRKWHCYDKSYCVPVISSNEEFFTNTSLHASQELCRLICGTNRGFWPIPYEIKELSENYITFNVDKLSFDFRNVSQNNMQFLNDITHIFKENLRKFNKIENSNQKNDINGRGLNIIFNVTSSSTILDWNTDESYTLNLKSADSKNIFAEIDAETIYGARHGLETLSQMIAPLTSTSDDERNMLAIISKGLIKDKPLYKHRGLLLDTSRNYLSLKYIRETIDGMSISKLNVFHWHITDAQSFPLEVKSYPEMAEYGSYSPDKIYKLSEIKSIIDYAKIRGIRVIMEIDAPAHAGFGWQWGRAAGLGNLAVCVNKQPWRLFCIQPPCGQLNPVNPNVSVVMREIYRDLIEINKDELNFHMGGDEVHMGCWNSTREITDEMRKRGYSTNREGFLQLWSDFQDEMLKVYQSIIGGGSQAKVILWSSDLTNPVHIRNFLSPSNYIIQTWVEKENSLNHELLKEGYQLIISTKNAWYFDHGFWGVTQYYGWKKVYANKILADSGVLGGEGCMWGEFVDQNSLHTKIWPRAAALAERLWSDPIISNYDEVETRLNAQTKRLTAMGLTPDALRPEWCLLNEGNCPNYH
uniref:Beta-hexosaminidase n=1 Tax=Culicoides sonorensis TaxID=179676 RepID=A0A336MD78_CULSO